MTRYEQLATLLAQRIEQGLYRSGERLPSVRSLSSEHGVSISTVQQAYHLLEDQRLISPQPRSGYFVMSRKAQPPLPPPTRPEQHPVEIVQWESVLALVNSREDDDITCALGHGSPNLTQATIKPLWREMGRLAARHEAELSRYDCMQGMLVLREQIARLMVDSGCHVSTSDIVITNGCQEALSIAIRAVCQPGDIVAVESPLFHGTLQMLRAFGVRVVEIPTDARHGISVEALELALEQWPIKAVLLVANCNNPLGFIMPPERKKKLLSLARRFDIAVIEDDVYGELAWDYPRPGTLKALDDEGRVLLCSSFSKTLAPGLRVGWIVPGRYFDRALHLKYVGTGSTATVTQFAVAMFIRNGHYHRHIRRMRQFYQRNLDDFSCLIRHYFPCGICLSRPQGGFLMWVEMPGDVDILALNTQFRARKIQIAPGTLLSASGKYRNCMRINYAMPLTPHIDEGLQTLGTLLSRALEQQGEQRASA